MENDDGALEKQLSQFKDQLSFYSAEERDQILFAAGWAREKHGDQKRLSGEPFFIHPLAVAGFLVTMRMDHETLIAALLHDVLEDTPTTSREMEQAFGPEIVQLVDGVTKISTVKAKSKTIQEAETLRKMLIAMTRDIRVIIIKLADKYHNMSTLEFMAPERRKEVARECLELYAPLADRLGISWLKTELENLCLKHLNPAVYEQISAVLTANEEETRQYLDRVERAIRTEVKSHNIKVDITARAKHIYSIYQKMKIRNKSLEEIYDILGLRILCDEPSDCYTVLGLVHKLFRPIEGRFKDYIAMPKTNQYQSLHTTVMGYDVRHLEVQIRTREMHEMAEYGIAAHWLYKQNDPKEKNKAGQFQFINKLKRWNKFSSSSTEFLDEIKEELLKESIYVFTPRGHIVELPKNSTPVDFAYHIHTDVGNHCMGAKADGTILPLNRPLQNTQVVEILTSPNAQPGVNWLRFVKTGKARYRIRQWLNSHEENLLLDKNIIAKKPSASAPAEKKLPEASKEEGAIITEVPNSGALNFKIGNEKNMLISLAGCCQPKTGDEIIGYVSRGRGIIVHRSDCPNLGNINEFKERCVDVEWEIANYQTTRRFRVTSKKTSDLFSEIEGAVRKYKGHLVEGRLEEDDKGRLTGSFTMEMESEEAYRKALKNIRTIPSVLNLYAL
ncbi:MAG: bifunctional (p)ppGpp synthetase/guanosine-3',5'-bis(diphosphate) 3'-pyrophosphohydrolase [Spirochaetales bacterium]|jgi:GTP pyrophosphokinase|nr:bifunctional (p)ppGpp synthetase/guanosine-3',5'-bis(diphosphate) 3'-pyrophosphohydrolase [Spirochaetales bacterium]